MARLKLYITLDTLLENENYSYVLKNKLYEKNDLFIQAINNVNKEFNKLIDIIFICKSKENKEEIEMFLENSNFTFKYETLYLDLNEILNLHDTFTKDYTLIDINEELLCKWSRKNGKAIKYSNVKNFDKSTWEMLEIRNNYETSEEYYKKLVNYIHLCH